MRILIATDWFLPRIGGIELHLRDLARHLINAGHQIELLTPTPGPGLVDGITIHRLNVPLMPKFNFIFSPKGYNKLREALENLDYDLIHIHGSIISPTAFLCLKLAAELQKPCLYTSHSVLKVFKYPIKWVLKHLKVLNNNTIQFSAVSSITAKELSYCCSHQNVHLLPNGIDIKSWQQTSLPNLKTQPFKILSVMRLQRRKRPMALLKLIRVLKKQDSINDFQLTIIGEGPERKRVEDYIKIHQLEKYVTLTGYLDRSQIKDYFQNHHVFVLPTILEAFGIAVIEAIAGGLPVLVHKDSGAQDYVIPGENGFFFKSDQDLLEILTTLINKPETIPKLICSSSAQPYFWPKVVEKHLQIYQQCLLADSHLQYDP